MINRWIAEDQSGKTIAIEFTQSELELLRDCVNKHFFMVGGYPSVVVSSYSKLNDAIEKLSGAED